MEGTETKHRKAVDCDQSMATLDISDAPDSSKKKRGSAQVFSVMQWMSRRRSDIIGCSLFWIKFVLGYIIFQHELRPLSSPIVKIEHAAGYLLMSLFTVAWFGVLYHGPGRPGEQRPESSKELSPTLASAFAAGRHLSSGPKFDCKESWCDRCRTWKPPLASHCRICDKCCFFMDHHCMLVGECIGFRNLRNYLVLLGYGQAIHAFLTCAILQRLAWEGMPAGSWEWGKLALWVIYLAQGIYFVHDSTQTCLEPYNNGWRSRVHCVKFNLLPHEALALSNQLGSSHPREYEELYKAYNALQQPGAEFYRSPFNDVTDDFDPYEIIFGAPFSWRYFLPFVAGGSGDVFNPPYSNTGCEAWSKLGTAMERGRKALAQEDAKLDTWLKQAANVDSHV